MKISVLSIPVGDQAKALDFYSQKLLFITKQDIPLGGGNRWLTMVSPEDQSGTELLLEPSPKHFEPAKTFQEALYAAGIPWTQFNVDDVEAEYARLTKLDVEFKKGPTEMGPVKFAILDDTCGNFIQLVEMLEAPESK